MLILRCCNTCEEVQQAYRIRGWQMNDLSEIKQCKGEEFVLRMIESKGQGCRIYGRVVVGKV